MNAGTNSCSLVKYRTSLSPSQVLTLAFLFPAVPKDGLKSQTVFDEIRMSYIKELGKAIVKREENSSQNWQRFYQLTKLLDSMHEVRRASDVSMLSGVADNVSCESLNRFCD